jgi:hypothetical protein
MAARKRAAREPERPSASRSATNLALCSAAAAAAAQRCIQHCKWIACGTDGLRGKGCTKVVEGFVFFLVFFRAAIASGLVTVILRTFSAPLPKLVVLNAFEREENAVVRFISRS